MHECEKIKNIMSMTEQTFFYRTTYLLSFTFSWHMNVVEVVKIANEISNVLLHDICSYDIKMRYLMLYYMISVVMILK